MIFPSSVDAKPHCGLKQSCSSGIYLVASSMRALIAALSSNSGNFELIKPNTTRPLCGLLAKCFNGSNPPERSSSYQGSSHRIGFGQIKHPQ